MLPFLSAQEDSLKLLIAAGRAEVVEVVELFLLFSFCGEKCGLKLVLLELSGGEVFMVGFFTSLLPSLLL